MTRDQLLGTLETDATSDTAARIIELAVTWLARAHTGEGAVSSLTTPAAVAARFDEPMPVQGHDLYYVVGRLRDDVLRYANRLSHPKYMGHQVSAPLPIAAWTDALVSAMNNGMAVMEMSPTITHVEQRVVRRRRRLAGRPRVPVPTNPEAVGLVPRAGR